MAGPNRTDNFLAVLSQDLSPENGVEKIIESKVVDGINGRVRYYQVQWRSTWEIEYSLTKCCGHLINNFWEQKLRDQREKERKEQEQREKEQKEREQMELVQRAKEQKEKEQKEKELAQEQVKNAEANKTGPDNSIGEAIPQETVPNTDSGVKKRKSKTPIKAEAGSSEQQKKIDAADKENTLIDTSVSKISPESEEELEEEVFDFSDSSEFNDDPEDKEYVPVKPKLDKVTKPKVKVKKEPAVKRVKREKGAIKKCDVCATEYTKNKCPQCSLVVCSGCGIKYNNSFYKEKCRACTNKCVLCNQSYRKPSDLTKHIEAIHDRIKKYNCPKCPKSFTAKQYVTAHMEAHKVETNHVCDICHKRYKTGRRLNRHKKTHTGVKAHQCTICNRTFHQKVAMKTHLLTHSDGPRRFQCLLCKKGFNHKVSLKSHMLKHHDKNEQQAAVMIGLWKKYQKDEAGTEISHNNQDDVLAKALDAVAMNPLDGEPSTYQPNQPFPFIDFEHI